MTAATGSSSSLGPRRPGPGAIAVRRTAPRRVEVYASWNGATTVARWQVLAASAASLTARASARKRGFETNRLAGTATTFAVRALNASGRVLATSAPAP